MRARYPDAEGYVERDGVRIFYEVFGERRADHCCSCQPGPSSTRASGRRRYPTSRATTVSSPSTGAATDARADPRAKRLQRLTSSPPMPWPCSMRPARLRAAWSSLSMGARWACCSPPSIPERVRGAVFIGPALPLRHASSATAITRSTSRPTRRGLGEVQPPLLAEGLRRIPRVLLLSVSSPSRTPPSRSRTASAGRWRPTPETLIATATTATSPQLYEDERELCRAGCGARHWSSTATRTRSPPTPGRARRADRRAARHAPRRRAHPTGARPGQGQPAAARFRRPRPTAAAHADLDARPERARASARSTSRRPSAWATPSATPPSPPSCARCVPTWRSTGWRSTR